MSGCGPSSKVKNMELSETENLHVYLGNNP
jgi:hypothetical protein